MLFKHLSLAMGIFTFLPVKKDHSVDSLNLEILQEVSRPKTYINYVQKCISTGFTSLFSVKNR